MRQLQLPIMSQSGPVAGKSCAVYCNASEDAIEIFLDGVVGDEYDGCDAASIARTLSIYKNTPVVMHVNSGGGSAYDGVHIFNALQQHPAPTTGIIQGMAGSAASLAIIGCDKVQATTASTYFVHYAQVLLMGNKKDLAHAIQQLTVLDEQVEQVYSEHSGRSIEQVKADLDGVNGDGTFFSAEEAVAAGYVHEIIRKSTYSAPKREEEATGTWQSAHRHRSAQLRLLQLSVDAETN